MLAALGNPHEPRDSLFVFPFPFFVIFTFLSNFQEQARLLDPALREFLEPCAGVLRTDPDLKPQHRAGAVYSTSSAKRYVLPFWSVRYCSMFDCVTPIIAARATREVRSKSEKVKSKDGFFIFRFFFQVYELSQGGDRFPEIGGEERIGHPVGSALAFEDAAVQERL